MWLSNQLKKLRLRCTQAEAPTQMITATQASAKDLAKQFA
jgi:hypothetical protein